MDGASNDNRTLSGSERTSLERLGDLQARATEPATAAGSATGSAATSEALPNLHARLLRIMTLRSRRRELFGDDLFADPAWDILLVLLDSSITGRQESISDACVAAAVLHSTALRWLNLLESRGWVERSADPHDHRRILVHLTHKAQTSLLQLFGSKTESI